MACPQCASGLKEGEEDRGPTLQQLESARPLCCATPMRLECPPRKQRHVDRSFSLGLVSSRATDQNVALNDPLVTVLVPVVCAFTGNAVKLNVPDTLEDVSVAMVSVPLPARADADQLPVTVVPLVVMTFSTVVPEVTFVVPTTARAAKLTERVNAELFEAIFRFPEGLTLAALTVPV